MMSFVTPLLEGAAATAGGILAANEVSRATEELVDRGRRLFPDNPRPTQRLRFTRAHNFTDLNSNRARRTMPYLRKRRFRSTRRRFKSRRRFKRRRQVRKRIGHPEGAGTCKSRTIYIDNGQQEIRERSIYSYNFNTVPAGDGIDQRERNLIRLQGVAIKWEMRSNSTPPLKVNMAVISPRAGTEVFANQPQETMTNFFRNRGGSTRGLNFEASGVNANAPLVMSTFGINIDRWNVLMHKRFTLNPISQTSSQFRTERGSNFKTIKKYIPIKRQVRYESGEASSSETPIYFVFWVSPMLTAEPQTSLALIQNIMFSRLIVTTYFKDTLCV